MCVFQDHNSMTYIVALGLKLCFLIQGVNQLATTYLTLHISKRGRKVSHMTFSSLLTSSSALSVYTCRTWIQLAFNFDFLLLIRALSFFSWNPGNMANPQPSYVSFKSIIENPKMKVRNFYLHN